MIVANPRKVRAIYTADNKTDRKDAEMLARIARMDTKLLYPIRHGSEASQKAFMILKSRDALVRSRVSLINGVRSLLKSIGTLLPSGWSADSFTRKAREHLDEEHTRLVDAMLECILVQTEEVRLLDKRITAMLEDRYPDAQRLQSVGGVGPITALAFILTIDDPHRFNKARDIGPFLGMTPRRDQSGDCDKQLPITKAGNAMLRRLLVNCSQYILGPFGPPSHLREAGERISQGPGKNARKRAVVAVARKLAIVLMKMLKTPGATYEPYPGRPLSGAMAA